MPNEGYVHLVVLGVGSTRCAPAIIGALAGYFGERDLEVRLYDEDRERLDLFDRLARKCFDFEQSKHALLAFSDAYEALEGADMVILAVGENCARKFVKGHPVEVLAQGSVRPATGREQTREELIGVACEILFRAIPDGAPILDLTRDVELPDEPETTHVDLPALSEPERLAVPFQVLRWIHGEDSIAAYVEANRKSPIKQWIDENAP